MMEEYGVPYYVMTDQFKEKAKITNGQSKEEVELITYIKAYVLMRLLLDHLKYYVAESNSMYTLMI